MNISSTESSHSKSSNNLPDYEENSLDEYKQSLSEVEKSDASSAPKMTKKSKSTIENNEELSILDEHTPPILKLRTDNHRETTTTTTRTTITATVTTTTNTTATTVTSIIATKNTAPNNIQLKHSSQNKKISSMLSERDPRKWGVPPETAVIEAIKQESVGALEILFKEFPALLNTVLREQNQTPLTFSIELNNKKTIGYLLTCKNININHPGTDGTTALHTASAIGDLATLSILLAAGADPNIIDDQGCTPLISAAASGHEGVVQALLNHLGRFSKINQQDQRGHTALSYATVSNNVGIARLLLKYGANPKLLTYENKTPMIYAIERGHSEIIQVLIENGIKADIKTESGLTPFSCAVINGHTQLTETLLALRVKFPKNEGDPVAIAADFGHAAIIYCLHQHGYPIDEAANWGRTPLMKASIQGDTETVNLLIALGANLDRIDTDGKNSLDMTVASCSSHSLREESHYEVIATLLAHMNAPIKITEKTLKPLMAMAIVRANEYQDWGMLREIMAKGLVNSIGEALTIDLRGLKQPSAPKENELPQ